MALRTGRGRRKLAWAALLALNVLADPARADDEEAEPRGYGAKGSMELSLQLGFGSDSFGGGAGFRYYVIDGLAPGVEGTYHRAYGVGQGMALGSLRFAPLRFGSLIPAITARGGRVFLSDHPSGWAVGGDVAVLIMLSRHVAFELGYGFLRLYPGSFCADLTSCILWEPVLGVRITF